MKNIIRLKESCFFKSMQVIGIQNLTFLFCMSRLQDIIGTVTLFLYIAVLSAIHNKNYRKFFYVPQPRKLVFPLQLNTM